MNSGVELLLKRMDSHPEEFADHYDPYLERGECKWGEVIRQIMHRVEIIDMDNGHANACEGARPVRYGKPLGYLSDEDVLTLMRKLDETRAMRFERKVMELLLKDDRTPPVDAYAAPYIGTKGSF